MSIASKLLELKKHQGFMRYFKNTSWLLAEKILRMVVGLFVGIWIARYLGPEKFGLLSYAQSFVALFTAFATLGLDSILVRELLKDESKRDSLLGTAFLLKLLGAVLVLSLLAFATLLQNNDTLTNSLIFIIASATIFQSFNVIDFYFQSKVLSKFVVFSNTISLLISSIIKVFLLLNEAPLIAFAYVTLFDAFVLAGGFIYFYFKNQLSLFKWSFSIEAAKLLLKDSWPLLLSGVFFSIYMKIDQVMIKEMIGNDAVGQYSAAIRLSEAWYFIPMGIYYSLFPAIVNAKKTSEDLYYKRLQTLYDIMVFIPLVIAIIITFSGHWIVDLLFGSEYALSSSVLIVHTWSGIFICLGISSSNWFINENLQLYAFYRTLLGSILNIIMNLQMIPLYGIVGAAFSSIFTQMFALFLFNFVNKKTRKLFIMQVNSLLFLSLLKKLKNLI